MEVFLNIQWEILSKIVIKRKFAGVSDWLMEQEQLDKLEKWFDDYVAGFYGEDAYVNANLKLKEDHSKRTCNEMRYLAEELSLSDNQRRVAELIALFHDIGRFRQFVKYRTYNDARSEDHCLLSLKVLRETKVLEEIVKEEKLLIERAIEYHGQRQLPSDLDGECLLFSQLIRDADKLDVFYVVTEYYKRYKENPEEFNLEMGFPDEPRYSKQIVEDILRGQLIDYSRLRTLNDMKLLQLGWVYDVNFTATLKRIRQRRFLEQLVDFLPDNEDTKRVRQKIFSYIDSRIKSCR
jgi:putative nucleotidyltransferase with HDIG domain